MKLLLVDQKDLAIKGQIRKENMETQVWSSLPKFDNDEDEDDEEEFLSGNEENFTLPPGKRLAPVGANDEDEMINAKDSDKEYSVASSPGYNSVGGGSSRFWGGSGGGNSEANNGVNKELEEQANIVNANEVNTEDIVVPPPDSFGNDDNHRALAAAALQVKPSLSITFSKKLIPILICHLFYQNSISNLN